MNAEEFEDIKLLARIDDQDKQIRKLQDTRDDWIKIFNEKDKQIAALKAALISDRATLITRNLLDDISQEPECIPRSEDWGGVRDLSVEDRKHIAVRQLSRELPEIDWSDMK